MPSGNVSGYVYGITTTTFAVGLSSVITISTAPNVICRHVRHVGGGGTLFLGAQGTAHGTLIAAGAVLQGPASALYHDIDGPAGLAFAAAGATCTVSIIQALSQGYAGAY